MNNPGSYLNTKKSFRGAEKLKNNNNYDILNKIELCTRTIAKIFLQ